MTHGLYEPDAFTERLGRVSPNWNRQISDNGLGFGDLLDNLEWKKL
jgi:hypothetical protein